ncbi:MAG: phage capsid protein, partial [Firmicutes bacterium HGW-Firmicutes-19]
VSPDGNSLIEVFLPDMTAPGAVKKGEVEMVAAIAIKATKSAGVLRKIKVQ